MHISLVAIYFWGLTAVFAHPLKQNSSEDIQVLAFANVLEQLESAFYAQALEHFDASSFRKAGFVSSQIPSQQMEAIANDENIHAITLESAIRDLGGQAFSNCTFNFSSAFTNVDTMISTARVIENVGVGAYLGALTLFADPALSAIASSVLTVEARHQSIINLLSNATSIPQPFDVALSPADVLAVADTFITGCQLGFSANPRLTVTNNGTLQAGVRLNFSSSALNETISENQLLCEIITGGLNASVYQPMDDCMVPINVAGPMYVFITNDQAWMANEPPSNMNKTKHSESIVAGPALLFVNQPDDIGGLIRPGFNCTLTGNHAAASSTSAAKTTSWMVGIAPAPSTTTHISAMPTTSVLSSGLFTTMISPAQASALLSSLAG